MGVQQRMEKYWRNDADTGRRILVDYLRLHDNHYPDEWSEVDEFMRKHRLYGRMTRYTRKLGRLSQKHEMLMLRRQSERISRALSKRALVLLKQQPVMLKIFDRDFVAGSPES